MLVLVIWGLGLATGIVQALLANPANPESLSLILLNHQFWVTFVLFGVLGFLGNTILAKKAKEDWDWPGGPFQDKYAFTNLGIGILGVLTLFYPDHFRVAALVYMYLFGLSGVYTHVKEMVTKGKPDRRNIGHLVMDFAYQGFLTLLALVAGIF